MTEDKNWSNGIEDGWTSGAPSQGDGEREDKSKSDELSSAQSLSEGRTTDSSISYEETNIGDVLPKPETYPDEDGELYDRILSHLKSEFFPKTPTETILVTDLAQLEWEKIRLRKQRDEFFNSEFRRVGINVFSSKGNLSHPGLETSQLDIAMAKSLEGEETTFTKLANADLEKYNIDKKDMMAEAFRNSAAMLDLIDRKLAEIETRRRRLWNDLEQIRGLKAKPIEDAETIDI